jgi:Zn-dependent M28 family amino/carboxypeptidase
MFFNSILIVTTFMNNPNNPSHDVSQKRLYQDVEFLTSLQPARNFANLSSLNKAADYIYQEFQKLDCHTEIQTYRVDGKEYKNIIASFGKMDGERVIIGAHYDVCGDQPGADDNASAVAGLLETARLLHARKPALPYRIDFVAYSLEEPPYFASEHMGSAVHARYLHDNRIPVKAMICYEMIGYFSEKPNSQQFPDPALSKIYPNKGNFIIVVGRQGQEKFTRSIQSLMKANSQIDVQSIVFPYAEGLAGLSDHRNYWKYNYPAVMINDTSFLRNPNYHKKTDTIDTLDFKKMAEVVKGVYAAATGL